METIQYADYFELNKRGIKNIINKSKNEFDLTERTIICYDGTQWDYIEEDSIYEQRVDNHYHIEESFGYQYNNSQYNI